MTDAVFVRNTHPMEWTMMTYDEIRQSISELRAELSGCCLIRNERRAAEAEIAELEAQAAMQLAAIQAEMFPPDG